MEQKDTYEFLQETEEKTLITDNSTENYFKQLGGKWCCNETQKHIIALLKKGEYIYTIKKEIEETGEKVSLRDIIDLDRKRHEMNQNNNIEQNFWEKEEEYLEKKQILETIATNRHIGSHNERGHRKHNYSPSNSSQERKNIIKKLSEKLPLQN